MRKIHVFIISFLILFFWECEGQYLDRAVFKTFIETYKI